MTGDQRNDSPDPLETGASAAHNLRGAIKAGKTVSGAAKGAAAGPYGAAAGALWESRKTVGKLLAGMAVLLLLPVLFLLLLPGLVFGGFSDPHTSFDPDNPVFNSETAIVEICNEITAAITAVLNEGLADVEERIRADFAASDGDEMEVINPYAGNLIYNANQFVSQYCAAKEADFQAISLSDMAGMMRKNKKHLYSYRRTEEIREKTETDETTGEETVISEKWMIYTILYNGEAYFADQVFSLSEEQKELADNYAQNLSLFLGDGMNQHMGGWDGTGIPSLGDVRFTDGGMEVVYFNQMDERYAGKPYGTDRIGSSGCGPTAMAIVVSTLTGTVVDPVEMAEWAYENGYWCKNSGSYHALIPGAAGHFGLSVSGCTASEPQRILDALSEGKLVVAIMAKGHFTKSGHFIVLRGVKDGKILVADPGSFSRSEQLWDLSIILNEASRRAGAGGPFWIIG